MIREDKVVCSDSASEWKGRQALGLLCPTEAVLPPLGFRDLLYGAKLMTSLSATLTRHISPSFTEALERWHHARSAWRCCCYTIHSTLPSTVIFLKCYCYSTLDSSFHFRRCSTEDLPRTRLCAGYWGGLEKEINTKMFLLCSMS